MTKEYTIEVLKDLPWKLDKDKQNEAVKAVGKAIACIEAIDNIIEYTREFGEEMANCNVVDLSKESAAVRLVHAYAISVKKGVFKE